MISKSIHVITGESELHFFKAIRKKIVALHTYTHSHTSTLPTAHKYNQSDIQIFG